MGPMHSSPGRSRVRCFADSTWPSNSTWMGPPQSAQNDKACVARCQSTSLCRASLYNRYHACYLLKTVLGPVRDDPIHGSTACQLTQQPPTWRKLLALLQSAGSCLGQRAMRATATALADSAAARRLPFDVVMLNLDQSVARLRRSADELSRAGVDGGGWRRVPAVFGGDLDVARLQREGFVARGQHRNNIACAWSHFAVWAALANASRPRPLLVLEDDAMLKRHFVHRTGQLLRRCERLDFDLCSLTWYRHLTHAACVAPAPVGGLVRIACERSGQYATTGTAAYLISRRGARRALDLALPMRKNIDVQLGENSRALRWFAHEHELELAAHDFGQRSVRVLGAAAFARRRRARSRV